MPLPAGAGGRGLMQGHCPSHCPTVPVPPCCWPGDGDRWPRAGLQWLALAVRVSNRWRLGPLRPVVPLILLMLLPHAAKVCKH